MKTIFISFLSLGGILLSSCTTVEQREPSTRTTTTEETTVSRSIPRTVETQTIRNY